MNLLPSGDFGSDSPSVEGLLSMSWNIMNPQVNSLIGRESEIGSGRVRLAELFQSIQGEGSLTGVSSVFVRTTGCNLRCWFCDTPYTSWSAEGTQVEVEDLYERILAYDCQHVVVTGGEPLLQPTVVPLTHALSRAGKHITIETAGTVFRPVSADLFSISPKLSNSTPAAERSEKWRRRHERLRVNREVIREMLQSGVCQFKFVIEAPEDVEEVRNYLDQIPEISPGQVWLMPQSIDQTTHATKKGWLEPLARQQGYLFSPRLHIEMWGNVRGK